MLTGELRSRVDSIWNVFWSGCISNPLEVMEQITYLLFLRRLDNLHTLEENKAVRLNKSIERRIFPEGKTLRAATLTNYADLDLRIKPMAGQEAPNLIGELIDHWHFGDNLNKIF